MDLIFDTHALLWLAVGHARFSRKVADRLVDPDTRLFLSAVTAWEYSDLHRRGRLPDSVALDEIDSELRFVKLDYPVEAWRHALTLPDLHRDPVDRMLIAHAITADFTLVTADETMRRYPVKTLW